MREWLEAQLQEKRCNKENEDEEAAVEAAPKASILLTLLLIITLLLVGHSFIADTPSSRLMSPN